MTIDKPIKKLLAELKFNSSGLLPAIAQQHDSREVLMLAWMNTEALMETLETRNVCYWSRSRAKLWRKGELSGQYQKLIELRWDCDADTILLLVEQTGVACHTGRSNCFFRAFRNNKLENILDPVVNPNTLYNE